MSWQTQACRRCDGYHPRYCDVCYADPACHDHNCWSTWELEDDDVR